MYKEAVTLAMLLDGIMVPLQEGERAARRWRPDNWTYLDDTLPEGETLIDFYRATEPLHEALGVASGETNPACHAPFEKLHRVLRYWGATHPRRKKLSTTLTYVRRHRHRME